MASEFYDNAVFWIEVGRIHPNPFQPRREFDDMALESLADSIRQYGVLQPLVVTRKETERGDGGISVEYELIAGERRLRASKLARLTQVPVLIRSAEDTDKAKLEIAIIENLQREDLNPIDRAHAFKQLADSFNLKHTEIAKKVGKSREYVSNTLRLLALPEDVQQAVVDGKISEGHTRPILMLVDRPEQQKQLFEEIAIKKLTVREAERIARGIATDRARKQNLPPELAQLERELTENLGTRVQIETRENGGKVHIDFFTEKDIVALLQRIDTTETASQEKDDISPAERAHVNVDKTQNTKQEKVAYSPLGLFAYNIVEDPFCVEIQTEPVPEMNTVKPSLENEGVETGVVDVVVDLTNEQESAPCQVPENNETETENIAEEAELVVSVTTDSSGDGNEQERIPDTIPENAMVDNVCQTTPEEVSIEVVQESVVLPHNLESEDGDDEDLYSINNFAI